MAKRRPDHQLTQNNWDEELERDEVGDFQKADEYEMKNRVIKVAKRRIGRSSDETDANESGAKPASVFSGFSLVSNKSSIIGADGGGKSLFNFGSSFSSQQPVSAPFSSSSSVTGSLFGGQNKAKDDKQSEYIAKIKELNGAVFNCIKGHIDSGSVCILSPIFKDYEKYVKEIEEKHGNSTAAAVATATAATASATVSPAKTNHMNSSPSLPPYQFTFGAAKSTAATDSAGTNAASSIVSAPTQSTSMTPTFSFGNPSSKIATSSVGFSFSNAIQTPKSAENDKKSDGGTNGNGENAEDENDEPPKVEFKQVVEEESIYSKRCKVYVKVDADYKDRGTGTLYLKKVKDDKVQLIVRADTNLGNILLNTLLSSTGPANLVKNNVSLICIPTPESEPKPRTVLIRVKSEKDAAELLDEINKYKE